MSCNSNFRCRRSNEFDASDIRHRILGLQDACAHLPLCSSTELLVVPIEVPTLILDLNELQLIVDTCDSRAF